MSVSVDKMWTTRLCMRIVPRWQRQQACMRGVQTWLGHARYVSPRLRNDWLWMSTIFFPSSSHFENRLPVTLVHWDGPGRHGLNLRDCQSHVVRLASNTNPTENPLRPTHHEIQSRWHFESVVWFRLVHTRLLKRIHVDGKWNLIFYFPPFGIEQTNARPPDSYSDIESKLSVWKQNQKERIKLKLRAAESLHARQLLRFIKNYLRRPFLINLFAVFFKLSIILSFCFAISMRVAFLCCLISSLAFGSN